MDLLTLKKATKEVAMINIIYQQAKKYWKILKGRLATEGNETVINCHQLKMRAPDDKMRLTDVADTKQVLCLIQPILSKKVEPFKMWLAEIGYEHTCKKILSPLSAKSAKQLSKLEHGNE
jgi:hypothetical protein